MRSLPKRDVKVAPPRESSEPAPRVHHQAAIKKDLAWRRMPQCHNPWPRCFLRVDRDEPEGVITQVHRDVESDDDAADGAESRESHEAKLKHSRSPASQ